MFRFFLVILLLFLWNLVSAGTIVLKNGQVIRCEGPFEIKDQYLHYQDKNGTLYQVPLKVVDLEKSEQKEVPKAKVESSLERYEREAAEKKKRQENELYQSINQNTLQGADGSRSNGDSQSEDHSHATQLGSSFECRQLLGYVRLGNVPNLTRLLKEKIPFEGAAYQEGNLEQPIHVAVYNGNLQIVKILLDAGADPNQVNRSGETPLFVAIARHTPEHIDIARYLLDQGANPNIRSKAFVTALDLALDAKSPELIRLLGSKVNVDQMDKNGFLPIFKAIANKDTPSVMALLDCKLDTSLKSRGGNPILIEAVLNGGVDVVKGLVDHGFSLEVTDTKGRSPFQLAMLVGDFNLASFLLEKSPPEFIKSQERALVKFVQDSADEAAAFLLSKGLDANTRLPGDDPILILAARNGDLELVKLLVDYGADVHLKGVAGLTADMLATGLMKTKIETFLRERQSRTPKK